MRHYITAVKWSRARGMLWALATTSTHHSTHRDLDSTPPDGPHRTPDKVHINFSRIPDEKGWERRGEGGEGRRGYHTELPAVLCAASLTP